MKIRPTGAALLMIGMMVTAAIVMAADNPDKPVNPAKTVVKSKEISNTRSASCILRITFDSSVLPLNTEMLHYLVKSSGILGKVTKEILQAEIFPDVESFGNRRQWRRYADGRAGRHGWRYGTEE